MQETVLERLQLEVTRKQFLQYSAGAILTVFGLNNLITLLTGTKPGRTNLMSTTEAPTRGRGFGTSKFGV